MTEDQSGTESRKSIPIGYVALATGLSPHVIRVWERRYRAVAPERSGKRRRLYSQEDIDRLNLLKRARMSGRRIGSVAALDEETLYGIGRNDLNAAGSPETSIERNHGVAGPFEPLGACERAVRNLDASALFLALRRAEIRLPRMSLLTDVVAPLMHGVGDGWSAKRLGIMHEHFASNIVKAFLSDLLGRAEVDSRAPLMVVATPSGQYCEIGAMTAGVAAAHRGWKVLFFGADLPGEEIAAAVASKEAEAVCLSITCRSRMDTTSRELNRLRQQLPGEVRVLVGGQAVCRQTVTASTSNYHFFSSLTEFVAFLTPTGPEQAAYAPAVRPGY
jgi:DNA-binding transcriptional MerR regulator/methylmalonyl-CoA mutase cobalamin-binding subunit